MTEDRLQKQVAMHETLVGEYDKRYTPAYSRIFQEYWNSEILKKLEVPVHGKVLDMGCGTGIMLRDIGQYGYRGIGLDISHDMLMGADRSEPVVVGNGGKLPFRDGSLDAIVARGAIHHIPDIPGVFSEFYRVLNSGGQIVISEPSNDALIVRTARTVMYRKNRHFDVEDEGFRSAGIIRMIEEAGFELENLCRFGFFSYTFSGFPDILPVMDYVPFSSLLTRLFILTDRLLSRIPLLNRLSLHIIVKARKLERS